MATLDFDRLTIGDLATSGKGAKSAPFFYGKDAVVWQPEEVMTVAYEPGVFSGEDVSRVNLCLRPPQDVQDQLVELDEWVVRAVAASSERLFGRPQTEDQVRARYAGSLKVSDKGYPPVLKTKMNKDGKGAVRIWAEKKARTAPEVWSGCTVSVRLVLKSLYFMGANFGLTFEATDISIEGEPVSECPF